ncbi:MAG: amino acid adenylation domain-containing protein, partial [bacterium]|nr:amino acid adenylation domain-containing protein [bacterium]
AGDVILQKTTFVFDVSVWELFWWSFQGAALCLLAPGQEKDPAAILAAIEKANVSTIHFVPSMLDAFLEYIEANSDFCTLKSLQRVFSSGEALMSRQTRRFTRLLQKNNDTELINLYGPTEATVDVSYYNCYRPDHRLTLENRDRVPIGKPIDNTRLYIINEFLQLQPIGITGELCICGDGLARGYLNRPELTAEKFIRDVIRHSSFVISSSINLTA